MYNETYVKNTKRRGTMLDISYYEKTDEIIAQYTCEEKSLIPIIQGIQEESTGAFNLCCGETGNLRGKSLQCSKLL